MKQIFAHAQAGRSALALLSVGLSLAALPAQAQVVGGTDTGSTAPFGADAPGASQKDYTGEFQQIYSSAAFAGLTSIGQIAFSSALPGSNSDPFFQNVAESVNYNFTVQLFTTTATPTSASRTYATNKGVALTPVVTVTQTTALKAAGNGPTGPFDLVATLPSAITYSPLTGNLLLDVVLNSATITTPGGGQEEFQYGTSSFVSTVANSGGTGTPQFIANAGLLTKFSAAPEPSPITIVLIGFCAAGTLVARRRFAAIRG